MSDHLSCAGILAVEWWLGRQARWPQVRSLIGLVCLVLIAVSLFFLTSTRRLYSKVARRTSS